MIVVNLGTNDFSTPVHAGERWSDRAALASAYRERYKFFVRPIAARQPQAQIILMSSPLFSGEVDQVTEKLRMTGASTVTALRFADLALSACNSHPSLADDRRSADLLQQTIDHLAVCSQR